MLSIRFLMAHCHTLSLSLQIISVAVGQQTSFSQSVVLNRIHGQLRIDQNWGLSEGKYSFHNTKELGTTGNRIRADNEKGMLGDETTNTPREIRSKYVYRYVNFWMVSPYTQHQQATQHIQFHQ
jgi:hypothetical protein